MMAVVRPTVFGVSSASMAQHSPAQATGASSGQCTSPSGMCSRSPIRPPSRDRAGAGLADAEDGGQMVELDTVHLGGEEHPFRITAGTGTLCPFCRDHATITSCEPGTCPP